MVTCFQNLQGEQLTATDGAIGNIRDFYFDDQQWTVSYLIVELSNWLSSRNVLIPAELLGNVDPQSKTVKAQVSRTQVKQSAPVALKKPVSEQRREQQNRRTKLYLVSIPSASKISQTAHNRMMGSADSHLRSGAELQSDYWVLGKDGDIGPIHDFVMDDQQWTVRYIMVNVGWWFSAKLVLVPPRFVDRISFNQGAVATSLPAEVALNAPPYDAVTSFSEFEHRVADYWKQQDKKFED